MRLSRTHKEADTSLAVLVTFVLSGLLAVLVLGALVTTTLWNAAKHEALVDARRTAQFDSRYLTQPNLRPSISHSAPDAMKALDAVLLPRRDRSLFRIKLWAGDGTIVYSDERRLVGRRFPLGEEELGALRNGGTFADVSDLTRPENRYERNRGTVIEVYTRVHTPDGKQLLYEEYLRSAEVASGSRRVLWRVLPSALIALVLLWLVQAPVALLLMRRLEARRREREQLVLAAAMAGDVERERIARDLHDGVVQQISGAALELHAEARDLGSEAGASIARVAGELRDASTALRTLIVDVYPRTFREHGMVDALEEQLGRLDGMGVNATLDTSGLASINDEAEAVLYRVAQEALRNVARHAHATNVTVRVGSALEHRRAWVEISDDGIGFDTSKADRGSSMGLRMLDDLVRASGGTIVLTSSPEAGTTIRVEVAADAR